MKCFSSCYARVGCAALVILVTVPACPALADTLAPAGGCPGISQAKLPPPAPVHRIGELPASARQSASEAIAAKAPAFGAVDSSPSAHPEEYGAFVEQLRQIQKNNSYWFFPAIIIVLNTTGDELAVTSWMQQAAAEGNLAAASFLANRRLSFVSLGQEMDPSVQKAYASARKAADAGFAPAVIPVVRCLRAGIGVEKDPEAGKAYLTKACRAGDFRLRFLWLSLTERLQQPGDQDRPEVKSELQRGNHYVAYELSRLCTQPAERLEWMRKAADMGSDTALFELSNLLAQKDPKASLTLLNEAVRRQNVEAIFSMGATLIQEENSPTLKATGLKRDEKVGTYMIRLAAMHGHERASFILGSLYLFGKYGLPQNEAHAYAIFRDGASQGNTPSAILEAYCRLTGLGTPQDASAGKSLDELLRTGHPLAALVKAYTYYKGIGCEPSPDKVMEYCLLASGSNFPPAYIHMACVLAKGMPGMEPDAERAENYVRMAELSMGDTARQMYKELMERPEWNPIFL